MSDAQPCYPVLARPEELRVRTKARLKQLWRRRYFRLGTALMILALVGSFQYYLANVPFPVEVPPRVTAGAGREIAVIENPVVRSAQDLLLSHTGRRGEAVDVYFDTAVFSNETLQLFGSLGLAPPRSPGPISYITKSSRSTRNDSCRTSVGARLSNIGQHGARLAFFQPQAGYAERHRYVELTPAASELVLEMNTIGPADAQTALDSCVVVLHAGAWNQTIGGSVPITIRVSPDTGIRFHFESLRATESAWGDTQNLFEPFTLAGSRPLVVEGLRITAVSGPDSAGPADARVIVRAAHDKSPLLIAHLKIGPEQMEIMESGTGWVTADGKKVTVDLMERIAKNPIPAALVGTFNAWLLPWLLHIVSRRRQSVNETVLAPQGIIEGSREGASRYDVHRPFRSDHAAHIDVD